MPLLSSSHSLAHEHRPGFVDWSAIALWLAIVLVCFTNRIVPAFNVDRDVFISVGARLLDGDRLYAEVADNKDPLFFYLMAAEVWLGPWAEYGVELLTLLGAGLVCGWLVGDLFGRRLAIAATVCGCVMFMLTAQHYDNGGTAPPGILLCLLAISLATRGKLGWCGLALGALLFTKLLMFPVAATFVLVQVWSARLSRRAMVELGCCVGTGTATLATVVAVMWYRGELAAYIDAQLENFVYAQSNILPVGNFVTNLVGHWQAAAYYGPWLLVGVGLGCSATAIWLLKAKAAPQPQRAFALASLSTYVSSAAIVLQTTIWTHHLSILFIPLSLTLVLMAGSTSPKLPFILPAWMLGLAGSYLVDGIKPYANPLKMDRMVAFLGRSSPEADALRVVAPPGSSYARLGTNNDRRHGLYTFNYKLACPWFHQYAFYSDAKLNAILTCAADADYLIVHLATLPFSPARGMPDNVRFSELNARWTMFSRAAATLLSTKFACTQARDDIMICRRKPH